MFHFTSMIPVWLVGLNTEFLKVTFSLVLEKSKGKNGLGTGWMVRLECEPCIFAKSEIFLKMLWFDR